MKFCGLILVVLTLLSVVAVISERIHRVHRRSPRPKPIKQQRERYDSSVSDYMTERTCFFNEICKEEFASKFRCRCPLWSFCSSPGRYYNAFCSMSSAGYLWSQDQVGLGGAPYYRDRLPYNRRI